MAKDISLTLKPEDPEYGFQPKLPHGLYYVTRDGVERYRLDSQPNPLEDYQMSEEEEYVLEALLKLASKRVNQALGRSHTREQSS